MLKEIYCLNSWSQELWKKIWKILILKTHDKLLGWLVSALRGNCLDGALLCSLYASRGIWDSWHTHWQDSHRCPPHSPYHWSLEDTHTCSCPGCYGRDRGSCRAWRHTHQCQLYTADLEIQVQWMVLSLEGKAPEMYGASELQLWKMGIFWLVSCFGKSCKALCPYFYRAQIFFIIVINYLGQVLSRWYNCRRTSWFQTQARVF